MSNIISNMTIKIYQIYFGPGLIVISEILNSSIVESTTDNLFFSRTIWKVGDFFAEKDQFCFLLIIKKIGFCWVTSVFMNSKITRNKILIFY